ncbi:MAG: acylphosphatase [Puia sp.]|nr:acylphosphatase [Puia sp.]
MATIHLLIKGKVQGVFYRDTAKAIAGKLGVTGWVRNTPDGHVEAIVSGSEEQLSKFVEWAHQGPEAAVVIELVRSDRDHEHFSGFVIRE